MNNEALSNRAPHAITSNNRPSDKAFWRAFIRYCEELQYGEIEVLKIQDGLPVLAEVVKKKIKFP